MSLNYLRILSLWTNFSCWKLMGDRGLNHAHWLATLDFERDLRVFSERTSIGSVSDVFLIFNWCWNETRVLKSSRCCAFEFLISSLVSLQNYLFDEFPAIARVKHSVPGWNSIWIDWISSILTLLSPMWGVRCATFLVRCSLCGESQASIRLLRCPRKTVHSMWRWLAFLELRIV